MFKVAAVELSEEERVELLRRVRASTSQVRVARRARVILLCADGVPLRQIGSAVDMDQHQVGIWRRRFLDKPSRWFEGHTASGAAAPVRS